jgi:hypothetical protein
MLCKKALMVLFVAGLVPICGKATPSFANDPFAMNMTEGGGTYSGWGTFDVVGSAAGVKHFVLCASYGYVLDYTYAPYGSQNPPAQVITMGTGGTYSGWMTGVSDSCREDGGFVLYLLEDEDQDGVLDPEDGVEDSASVNVNFPPC